MEPNNEKDLLGKKRKIIFKVIKDTENKCQKNEDNKLPITTPMLSLSLNKTKSVEEDLTINSKLNSFNNDDITIRSTEICWTDKTNTTFNKILSKYIENKKDNSNDLEEYNYCFKLFFLESQNAVNYLYDEVKENSIQFYEKKHKAKISEIIIISFRRNNLIENKIENMYKYKSYLKSLLDPNNNKNFNELKIESFFLEHSSDWDYYEIIAMEVLLEKYNFSEFTSYVCLYLYDSLKKLKDSKMIESIKAKLKECPSIASDLSLFACEMKRYYIKRQNIMKNILSENVKQVEWTNELALIEILVTSFIAAKINTFTELDLTQHAIMSDNSQTIFSAMKYNKTVQKLVLNSNRIGEEGMWQLGRLLTFRTIKELDISSNQLSDISMKALACGIKNTHESITSLTKLNLSNNLTLTFECGKYISEIIELSPELKNLNMSRVCLEDRGVIPVISKMINLVNEKKLNIETLIIFQIKIGAEGIRLISNLLSLVKCPIKSLVLSDNKLELHSATELFKSLDLNETLEELILLNCDIGNDLAEEICKMLSKNNSLKSLNLYNNRIDSPVIFKKILKTFQKIEKSNICNLSTSKSLKDNETISEDIYDKFFSLNPCINNLYNLDMPLEEVGNRLNLENVNTLKKKNIKSLKYLDLSKNKCILEIDNELLGIIEQLNLESLDISQNFDLSQVEEKIATKFKDAITKIQNTTKIIY